MQSVCNADLSHIAARGALLHITALRFHSARLRRCSCGPPSLRILVITAFSDWRTVSGRLHRNGKNGRPAIYGMRARRSKPAKQQAGINQ